MPFTINGVGTTYFGKKNLESYQGVCDSCNAATTLSDYETGHFICVLFIPLIPLGRKMVLGECESCTRHRVMSLRDWQEVREQSISDAIEALSDHADSPEKALKLLGTYSAFKQYEDAKQLAAVAKRQHWADFDTVLAIGDWYEQMRLIQEAEECFDRCLELNNENPASKRIRCARHIAKGELPESQVLIYELFAAEPLNNADAMFMLAGAYQKHQQPHDAYEVYKQLLAALPQLRDDKELAKEIRRLEKSLGLAESIVPKKGFFR